jgi:hypothetical protein
MTTQPVEIRNLMVLDFYEQSEFVYEKTRQQIEDNFPSFLKDSEALCAFAKQVRHEGKQLQDGEVDPLPSKELLEEKKEHFLCQYWQYKATFEKLKKFADYTRKSIDFLKPDVHTYSEGPELKELCPMLHKQIKSVEEICLDHFRELEASRESIVALEKRMWELLFQNQELSWSLQRFCGLVANDGKPLSFSARSLNYCTTPTVLKPKDRSFEIDVQEDLSETDRTSIEQTSHAGAASDSTPNDGLSGQFDPYSSKLEEFSILGNPEERVSVHQETASVPVNANSDTPKEQTSPPKKPEATPSSTKVSSPHVNTNSDTPKEQTSPPKKPEATPSSAKVSSPHVNANSDTPKEQTSPPQKPGMTPSPAKGSSPSKPKEQTSPPQKPGVTPSLAKGSSPSKSKEQTSPPQKPGAFSYAQVLSTPANSSKSKPETSINPTPRLPNSRQGAGNVGKNNRD